MSKSIEFPPVPQAAPIWSITAQEILDRTNKIINGAKAIDDDIGAEKTPLFENSVLKYQLADNKHQAIANRLTFYQRVSPDKDLREASTKSEELLENYYIEAGTREDVYKAVKAVYDNIPETLDPESKRLIEKTEMKYRRNGLSLDKETRAKVAELRKELTNTCIQFSKTLDAENGFIAFTKSELDGIPERVFDQFSKITEVGVEKYKMTFKYPDINPVMKYAKNSETRKRAHVGYENRCQSNTELVVKAVKLRAQIAELLGYKTHSDFVLEERMAKNADTVGKFLTDLKSKITTTGQEEVKKLLELKNEDLKSRELPAQDEFYSWDYSFYDNMLLEKEHKVDNEKISEYFPLEHTVQEMFAIFENLFSITFNEVTDEMKSVWHPDVKQYSAWKIDNVENPEFLGWFYLDLHPRENKYSHAANFNIGPSYIDENGKTVYPVTALVCNFSKPTAKSPSLLKHSEVTTFFHEFGHGIHDLVGHAKYAKFTGTSSSVDFAEAPSQMLEFWTWNKQQLKDMSGHYTDLSEKLDDELIDSLIRAKHLNGAFFMLQQLMFGAFDYKLHISKGDIDIPKLWNEMRGEVYNIGDTFTYGFTAIGHFMNGYDSGLYGYLWSEAFAADMYYTKFKADPMNNTAGREYRDKVIGRGATVDENVMLQDFLGREPNNEAFLEEQGIKV